MTSSARQLAFLLTRVFAAVIACASTAAASTSITVIEADRIARSRVDLNLPAGLLERERETLVAGVSARDALWLDEKRLAIVTAAGGVSVHYPRQAASQTVPGVAGAVGIARLPGVADALVVTSDGRLIELQLTDPVIVRQTRPIAGIGATVTKVLAVDELLCVISSGPGGNVLSIVDIAGAAATTALQGLPMIEAVAWDPYSGTVVLAWAQGLFQAFVGPQDSHMLGWIDLAGPLPGANIKGVTSDGRGRLLVSDGAGARWASLIFGPTRRVSTAQVRTGTALGPGGTLAPAVGFGTRDTPRVIWKREYDGLDGLPSQAAGMYVGSEAADDFRVAGGELHSVQRIEAWMFTNSPFAKGIATIYADCDGLPGEELATAESALAFETGEDVGDGFRVVKLVFLFDLMLDGGESGRTFWLSVQGTGAAGPNDQWFWSTGGNMNVAGSRGAFRVNEASAWIPADAAGCDCSDFAFRVWASSCKVLHDALRAEHSAGVSSFDGGVSGTTRAADDVPLMGCDEVEICSVEAVVFTNCVPPRARLEVYADGCGQPGELLFVHGATGFQDLGYSVTLGGQTLRAYVVFFEGMERHVAAGKNILLTVVLEGSGGFRERGFVALSSPCEGCARVMWSPSIQRGGPGESWQVTRDAAWQPRDLAMRVAVRRSEPLPGRVPVAEPWPCAPDVNRDGVVNVADLLEFIATWFAGCP